MDKLIIGGHKRSCKTCEFFSRIIDKNDITKNQGPCKRNPPVPYPVPQPGGQLGIMNITPMVNGDDFCGEWYPREGE